MEKVTIKNKKGLRLAGYVHRPKKEGVFPAVILLHGFTGYKEEEHIETLAKELADNGLVAVRFDCSGFGESAGTIERDYRFSNYLQDVEGIYSYLESLNFVDKERIGIWGHSMGGQLAVIYAATHKEIKAVVAVSATTSVKRGLWLAPMLPVWERQGHMEFDTSRFGKITIPYEFIDDRIDYDALEYAPRLSQPLLIIIGTDDDTVAPDDTRQIYERALQPKKLVEIQGMGHDYKKHPEQVEKVNNKVVSFLRSFL